VDGRDKPGHDASAPDHRMTNMTFAGTVAPLWPADVMRSRTTKLGGDFSIPQNYFGLA
jgi:hypothetical protein